MPILIGIYIIKENLKASFLFKLLLRPATKEEAHLLIPGSNAIVENKPILKDSLNLSKEK